MKTFSPRPRDIERRWYVIDADGVVLGRLASEVAQILRGKHKPIFAPHADTGDHVIVINASRVRLTGGKESKKVAYHHSGYPGGLREVPYDRLMAERPSFVVEKAIKGMLPKNRLGRAMAGKLHVYDGAEHRQQAQQPTLLPIGTAPTWEGLPPRRVVPPTPKAVEKPKAKAAPKGATTARAAAKPTESKKRTPKAATSSPAGGKKKTTSSPEPEQTDTAEDTPKPRSKTRRGGRSKKES